MQNFKKCKWIGATVGSATLQNPNVTLNLMPRKIYTLDITLDVVRQWIKNGLLEVVEDVAIAAPQKVSTSAKKSVTAKEVIADGN
jgi:hypothetical protein